MSDCDKPCKAYSFGWKDFFALASVLLLSWSCQSYLSLSRQAIDRFNNTQRSLPHLLFFNRVHKTGSQTVWALLDRLATRNDFTSYHHDVDNARLQGVPAEVEVPDALTRGVILEQFKKLERQNEKSALSYVRHVYFLDFEEFQEGYRPTWISVVRDPLERVISWYYYSKTPWYRLKIDPATNETVLTSAAAVRELKTSLDECVLKGMPQCTFAKGQNIYDGTSGEGWYSQIAFFCGHDPEVCFRFGSRRALSKAMENVERKFAVVGVTEDFPKTLKVLESYVPRFFHNATEVYKDTMASQKVNKNDFKPEVSEEVRKILRRNFTAEFEFYHFCRQRLEIQYALI